MANDPINSVAELLNTLNNSRIATENNALYQTIKGLIDATRGITTDLVRVGVIPSGGGGSSGVVGASYLTTNPEPTLPNSRRELAGSGIRFDDRTPKIRTIIGLPQFMIESGNTGEDGSPGPPGIIGATGPTGIAGIAGVGIPGFDGDQGEQGYPIPGPVGPMGTNVIADAANVATSESTNSTSYVDLATAGPAVTLATGANVIIWLSAICFRTGTGNTAFMSVAVSGATTTAASDANSTATVEAITVSSIVLSRTLKMTGLTPGSNTFTAKYRVDGSTYSFFNRSISVLALP